MTPSQVQAGNGGTCVDSATLGVEVGGLWPKASTRKNMKTKVKKGAGSVTHETLS
jgi:hypothetical protein